MGTVQKLDDFNHQYIGAAFYFWNRQLDLGSQSNSTDSHNRTQIIHPKQKEQSRISNHFHLPPLAPKYAMSARMCRHGMHLLLELLRHRLPASFDHMLSFIYLSYSMMDLLRDGSIFRGRVG